MQNSISNASQHIRNIIGILNEQANYAVLRNYEGLPDSNDSRDIDIIITRKSFNAVRNRIVEAIDNSGWKIITYLRSDRLVTFVCGYQQGDDTEIVQWDFFVNTSVFGILLMDADEFLEHRQFNGFLYYVDITSEFLDKYLYNRVVGAPYPAKYLSLRLQVKDSEHVKLKLSKIFGVSSLEECDFKSGKQLLVHALWQNLKTHPFNTLRQIICFLYTFIHNYIFSNTGFSIGFSGPDGVGKTTVIDLFITKLSPVFAKAHKYYHFRPELFKNIGDVAHSAGLKKEVDREYSNPHRGGKIGKIGSLLRLSYYVTDYILGYFLSVKTTIRITRLAIFDRYYTDIICDSRRSRIFLSYKFLYWFGWLFIPSLDYNIMLTATTKTILNRKQELNAASINEINKKIDYLAAKQGFYKILNESTPDEITTEILRLVFAAQHTKNLKRLK